MSTLLSLLDAWPQGPLGATLLTTFSFDVSFFESHLLPALQGRGARPIVVFLDHSTGLQPNASLLPLMGHAGVDYHLVPVDRAPYVFHPKVHLFTQPQIALVGSGNLTWSGCGGNLEAFDRLTPEDDGAAVGQVFDFFESLLQTIGGNLPYESRKAVRGSLAAIAQPEATGLTSFLSSLVEPLMPQLRGVLEAIQDGELLLAAPFHDEDHGTSIELASLLGAQTTRVASGGQAPTTVSTSALMTGILADGVPRRLHAKILHAQDAGWQQTVIGSANLTRAAYGGGRVHGDRWNVEAVVVRTGNEVGDFTRFLDTVAFTACGWPPKQAADRDMLADEHPLHLPPFWAELRDGELTVGGVDLGQFKATLESVHQRQAVDFKDCDGVFHATTPFVPHGAAILHVRAPGYADTSVLVHQLDLLLTDGTEARLARVMRMVETDQAAWEDRREILTCLGDLLALLLSPEGVSSEPPNQSGEARPSAGTGSFDSTRVDEIVIDDDAFMRDIGRMNSNMSHLMKLASAIARLRPTDEDLGADDEQQSDRRARGRTGEGEHYEEDERRRATRQKEDDQLIHSVLALCEQQRSQLGGEHIPAPRRTVVYAALVKLLIEIMVHREAPKPTVARALLAVLRAAWGERPWPETGGGWLQGEQNRTLRGRAVLAMTHAAMVLRSVELSYLDDCGLILRGIESTGAEPVLPSSWPEVSVMAGRESIIAEVRSHRPRSDKARRVLEPLWSIEHADRDRQRCAAEKDGLEREAAELKPRLQLSRRNARHQSAVAKLAEIGPKLAEATKRLEAAEARLREAKQVGRATSSLDPDGLGEGADALTLWKSARPRRREGIAMRVWNHAGSVCPACHVSLPTHLLARLDDVVPILQCPTSGCGVLITIGQPSEVCGV